MLSSINHVGRRGMSTYLKEWQIFIFLMSLWREDRKKSLNIFSQGRLTSNILRSTIQVASSSSASWTFLTPPDLPTTRRSSRCARNLTRCLPHALNSNSFARHLPTVSCVHFFVAGRAWRHTEARAALKESRILKKINTTLERPPNSPEVTYLVIWLNSVCSSRNCVLVILLFAH